MATPNETNSGPSGESAMLLHTALFKQVSSEEAEELLPHLQHAEYNKGIYIFREGDTDHRMYLLERGRVKLISLIVRQACAVVEHSCMQPGKCW